MPPPIPTQYLALCLAGQGERHLDVGPSYMCIGAKPTWKKRNGGDSKCMHSPDSALNTLLVVAHPGLESDGGKYLCYFQFMSAVTEPQRVIYSRCAEWAVGSS